MASWLLHPPIPRSHSRLGWHRPVLVSSNCDDERIAVILQGAPELQKRVGCHWARVLAADARSVSVSPLVSSNAPADARQGPTLGHPQHTR